MQLINAISNNRFASKHGLKITWGIAAVCLLWLLLSSAMTLREQHVIKNKNYAEQSLPTSTKSKQPNYRASDIVSANLFGDPNPKPVVRQAPKTTLDLTLQGILWATDSNMARAIIMSGKNSSKLYSVGESIEGAGASVKEIRDGEVILNRNGAVESLPLIKKTSSGNRQLITYSSPLESSEIITPVATVARTEKTNSVQEIRRSSAKPRSPNAQPRKVRKPNFSGLDRALKKMGEI